MFMAVHSFHPTRYYNTLGSHSPVLHIADGDIVETTTVDAAGYDAGRAQPAAPGNPQTGPFSIDGAEPGDTLMVVLERIRPNRTYGFAGAMVAPNVVDPSYTVDLPWPQKGERRRAEWYVDAASNTARLVSPRTALGELILPIAPMLGCFGVAPAGEQAISTATSAEHGGNMDYRGFVEGVTVYFPVFMPGALFHLGDGHAVQGDGEIVGTGIEISMDVRFRVHVLKGKRIQWPRGENADYIFTVGNARPLDQCVQHATTEMLRWLQEDYGLDAVGANILMGQVVEYDLGNIFDPAYTMVCKIPKRVLASIQR
jgi:acetamidase/formamidase